MTGLAFHPYANLFPLIEGDEFLALAEDIRRHGLRDRIELLGDAVLDGRNRYRALVWLASTGEVLGAGWGEGSDWEALGLEGRALGAHHLSPDSWFFHPFMPDRDGDPLAYVLSKNLTRRHLTESQRAMVAADLATMGWGGDRTKAPIGALTDRAAAEVLKVSERSVERAKTVRRAAPPEVVEAVKSGDLSVAAAAEIAAQPADRQAEIVQVLTEALRHQIYSDDRGRLTQETKKALAPLIREIRADKIAAKKDRRAAREAETGRKIQALPGAFYGVAIEDFEWHHAAWSEETGSEKSPSMHYETALDAQTPEAIAARCAERFACLAPDCILFKWATVPHLAIAIRVLELQGFRYVTSLVWNKQRSGEARGPGYWFSGEHEIVLVGVRGKVEAPATAHFRSNFSAPVGGHSEKPDNLHEIIEFHWPNYPKVEFNARRARPGWAAWGFDAPEQIQDYPREEASGTAREAPSTLCERETAEPVVEAAVSDVGPQAAPLHVSTADRLDWEALRAIIGMQPVDEIVAADLLKRGLIFVTDLANPARGYTPTRAGAELGQRLHQIFWEPPSAEEIRRRFFAGDDSGFSAGVPSDAGGATSHGGASRPIPVEAKRARRVYPAGHTFTMTNPTVDGEWRSIGTCTCGHVISFPWPSRGEMDAAIEAHWRQFDGQPEKVDGRGDPVEVSSFATELPRGETVTAAADATAARASPAAAVADDFTPPAFPPAELYELRRFIGLAAGEAECARLDEVDRLAPAYVARGLVREWCGRWQLSPAGEIRLGIVERERAARLQLAERALSLDDFAAWSDLEAVVARQLRDDGGTVRHLVGEDLAWCNTKNRVFLTEAGEQRLAELEAIVDRAAGITAPQPKPIAPRQLDLVEVLQGAP